MNSSEENAFIRRIRAALGQPPHERRSGEDLFRNHFTKEIDVILDRIENRSKDERQFLLNELIEAAKPINLNIIQLKDPSSVGSAIAELVKEKEPEWGNQKSVVAWNHPLIEWLSLPEALAEQRVPVYFTELNEAEAQEASAAKKREQLRQQIIGSYVGVTSADFCMADTATLVMRTRPGQARSVSLLPSIHIAVITIDKIIANLKELYTLLKWDCEGKKEGLTNCMTFISGPSKTADVEATMVHGAHGPREVYIFVITA